MKAIYKRELRSYFNNVNGFIFIAFMFLIIGIFTSVYNLYTGYSNFEYALSGATFAYLIAVPVLTMRTVAEEKKQKTDKLLYSLPISVKSIVLGKLFAMITVLAIPIAVSGIYPLVLSLFGEVSLPVAYSSLFGYFLLGAALLSFGLFISCLTENQLIAAVVTLICLLITYWMRTIAALIPSTAVASVLVLCVLCILLGIFLYYMTKNLTVSIALPGLGIAAILIVYLINESLFEGLIQQIMSCLEVFDKIHNFVYGLFDVTAVVYYLSVIFIFTFLSVQSLEKKRWS